MSVFLQMCQTVVKTTATQVTVTKGCVAPTEVMEDCPEEGSTCTTYCNESLCNVGYDNMEEEPGMFTCHFFFKSMSTR